jgi:signal transduction histidine kinase
MFSDEIERQETAQRIAREVQRLRRLVADMQQMSSFESGRVQLELATLDLHTLVDETLAVIAPECEQTSITVYNEISESTPPALADSDRITQVLLNLLDNARRHTPPGGKICVGASTSEKDLHIRVSDSGTGIDPVDLPHIFKRFYRADRSRTTSTGGSGLGLSIVKAIIQQHNGSIWAESTPGQGTSITFTLPRA